MAVSQKSVFARTLNAASDLSAKRYRYVGEVSGEYEITGAAAGVLGAGFLMNAPLAGEFCEVATEGGAALAVASATVSAAEVELKNDTSGEMTPATTAGDFICAISAEAAASGDVFAVRPVNYYKHA